MQTGEEKNELGAGLEKSPNRMLQISIAHERFHYGWTLTDQT
jgi:hypothetical protein